MKRIAVSFPILSGILFGSVGVFVRKLTAAGLDNPTVIFIRAFFAVFMMLVFLLVKDKTLLKISRPKNILWVFCAALLGMMGTNLLFNVSSNNLSLAFAAVLLSIAPVYTMVISRFLFGDRITMKKIICVIMTISGCILVSGVIGSSVALSAAGLAAGILSGVTYGLYSIFSKMGTNGGMRSLTITFYCLVIIAVVLAPFADFGALTAFVQTAPAENFLFLLMHSLFVGVLPYGLLTQAMEYIDAGKASILASCEPVAAMVFGVLFFGEIPTVFCIAGLLITIAALALLCRQDG